MLLSTVQEMNVRACYLQSLVGTWKTSGFSETSGTITDVPAYEPVAFDIRRLVCYTERMLDYIMQRVRRSDLSFNGWWIDEGLGLGFTSETATCFFTKCNYPTCSLV